MTGMLPLAMDVGFAGCLWGVAWLRARAGEVPLSLHEPVSVTFMSISIVLAVVARDAHLDATASLVSICAGVCAATDRQTGYIFDRVVACSLGAIAVVAAYEGSLTRCAIGACFCSGLMFVVHYATRGNGLGLGDVKLGAVIGALGVASGTVALACAFVLGGAAALAGLLLRRVRPGDRMRFGPYVAAGTWICVALQGFAR